MSADFDVIICGAGPAGCTAALALGSSGLKVALIEKETFPGEKVCGDAIPAFVPKVLDTINPEYTNAFEEVSEKIKINVCHIVAPNSKSLDLKFSEYGFTCKRIIFDKFLFELAEQLPNLTVFQDTQVQSVKSDDTGVIIKSAKSFNLKAQLVIGCDGVNSIIRRDLSEVKIDKNKCSVAARGYFRNIKDSPPGVLEFHFIKDLLPGYFWIFPVSENQFNVGLGMPAKTITEKTINLSKELLRIIESVPYLKIRFSNAEMTGEIKGHLLPPYSGKIPISGHRFMLCGDAAFLINPATGSGIGQAMQSGRFAGWHAIKCFEQNNFSIDFIKGYDKTVYENLWKENHRYSMLREFICKFEWRLNTLIQAVSKSRTLQKLLIDYLNSKP